MAISTNRADLSQIANVAKSTYNKASDTAAIKNARSLASLKPKNLKKSVLAAATEKVTSSVGTKVLGLTETDCTTLGEMLNKTLGAGNNRDLNYGVDSTDCVNTGTITGTGISLSTDVTNKVLSQIPNLSKKVLKITPAHETLLDKLISSNVKQTLKSIGVNNSKPLCSLNNSKGNLVNGMGNIGFTNMSKIKIGDMLSKNKNCLSDVLTAVDGGNNFAGISLVGTINTLSKLDVSKTVDFASKIGSDEVSREQFFSGYKLAINGDDDTNIENKLLLLAAVKKTSTNQAQIDKESIMTLGTTPAVISSIGNSTKITNSPVSDYNYVTSALTDMDPNWNKDIDGNLNYSNLKDNKRMEYLATSTALSTKSTSTDLTTGTVTKTVANDSLMSILIAQQSNNNNPNHLQFA